MSEKVNYKDNNDELTEVARNVKSHLLLCVHSKCTKQFTKSSTIWTIDDEYDWLLRLKCKKCKIQWAVCCKCKSCKTALSTNRQIMLHKNTYHKIIVTENPSTKRTNSVLDDIDDYLNIKKQKLDQTNESSMQINDLLPKHDYIKNKYNSQVTRSHQKGK